MISTNMAAEKRACAILLVILLLDLKSIAGKPFFGFLFCDLVCDDYDDDYPTSSSTTTSFDDLLDIFGSCDDCPTRRPTTPRIPTMAPGMMPPQPFTFNPPPGGMNVTMTNNGGNWFWSFVPLGGGPAGPPPAGSPAPTTAAPAAATTAAPKATTAAAGATTAAPTTAAA